MKDICIWDSQCGQEYTVIDHRTNEEFSNIKHGYLTAEIGGVFFDQQVLSEIEGIIEKSNDRFFYVHQPWQKKSLRLLMGSADVVSVDRYENGGVYGEFDPSLVRRVFSIWNKSGRWSSGVWVIYSIGSDKEIVIKEGVVRALRDGVPNLVIDLNEMHQVYIFSKEESEIASCLRRKKLENIGM